MLGLYISLGLASLCMQVVGGAGTVEEIGKAVYKGGEREGEEFVALFYNSFIKTFLQWG